MCADESKGNGYGLAAARHDSGKGESESVGEFPSSHSFQQGS